MQRSELTANFPADVLGLLDQTEEVQIEPRSPDGQRQQPVTIWVVVLGWPRRLCTLVSRPESALVPGTLEASLRRSPHEPT
jgi:hypothetical protein